MKTALGIQKQRVRAGYLLGLGVGITLTALTLTPESSKSGDKYMWTAVFGVIVLASSGILTWYVRRQEVATASRENLGKLHGSRN